MIADQSTKIFTRHKFLTEQPLTGKGCLQCCQPKTHNSTIGGILPPDLKPHICVIFRIRFALNMVKDYIHIPFRILNVCLSQ